MVFLILESTFMLNILKRNVMFDEIKLISTKGHLYTYSFFKNKIDYSLKEDKKEISFFFSTIDNEKNTIIIASDQDPAGELIAFEISGFFKKAKVFRFLKPVETLLEVKRVNEEYLLKYCVSKINVLKGVRYLEERFLSDYKDEKIKALSALYNKGITKVPLKD